MDFFLLKNNKRMSTNSTGFGLVETLVSVAIFSLVSTAAYGGFVKTMQAVQVLKVKNASTNLANEQIEIARNLPYVDVGIVNGLPAGKIPREQVLTREGINFNVTTSVRDIDDPFDGQIGEDPNDLSPADYKLVEFSIICADCAYQNELKYYARVSSLALETQGNNGALFVRVFDSNGQPLQGANVNIENFQLEDPIIIDETTNNDGMFQIVDAPTGTEAYQITVTKEDYSTDKTYTVGEVENPIPDKPHSNVVTGSVTQLSFYIDKFSDLDIYTRRNTCERIANVDFNLQGSKSIGYEVLKTDLDDKTDGDGNIEISDIEWDSYSFDITDSGWDLVGASPVLPVEVNPDTNQTIDLILTRKEPNALQVSVVDSETDLPISDAEIVVSNGVQEWDLTTGLGFIIQTDWSGGQGQIEASDDEARYFSNNGSIEDNSPAGDIKLAEFNGNHLNNGELESSIFDIGIESNFGHIFWNQVSQPELAGDESVKVQIATNQVVTATSTWDFIGPDGATTTYYTNSGQEISSAHFGDRYLKYKVFLSTEDTSVTPTLSNISFTLMTDCTPPGQVLFTDLNLGDYSINVTHPDYQEYLIDSYVLGSPWQSQKVSLIPNEE